MVLLQDEIATIKAGSRAKIRQQVRIGVTELTAMTWLPRLISELHDRHPGVYADLEVENGRTLYERLQSGHLDIIICPEFASDANLTAIHLESVEMKWMMQPRFIGKDHILSLHDLVSYPLVLQGGRSGAGSHLSRWLLSERLVFDRVLFTDSLMAVVGLTVAGLGVSHLPHRCFDYLIASKRIEIINTEPNPPDIAYVAIFRQGGPSHFMNKLAELMRELCDFSTII
jgi:DNA-binding transcriptional LysR family regulator